MGRQPRWGTSGRRWVLVLALAPAAVACGSAGDPAGAQRDEGVRLVGGSGSAEVAYQPESLVVEADEGLRALAGVSSNGSTLLFESPDAKWQTLKPGQVLVIKGLLARKVLAIDVVGPRVTVLTEPASLGEIARQARITMEVPVRFASAHAHRSNAAPPWEGLTRALSPTLQAQAPDAERARKAEAEGRTEAAKGLAKGAVAGVFSGWETTYSAVPSAGRLNLSLHMVKKVSGFVAEITGSGYIADFDLASDIVVERGVVERLQLTHRRLNGTMNFTWVVGKDTPGPLNLDDRIKLPAAITIPLHQFLGGFPLSIEIGSAIIIKPAITGGKEFTRGAFRITYDGYQHFTVKEGTIDADGKVTGDIEFPGAQAVSAAAPLGLVLAFAAPRIELSVGVSRIASMDDFKEAAEKVDQLAAQLIKRVFGDEAFKRYSESPMRQFNPSKAVEAAMGSDAAGYIELVTSSGMSATGLSVLTPCTRTDLGFLVRVGAAAQAFGTKFPPVSEDVFTKRIARIDPPGVKLCNNIGE